MSYLTGFNTTLSSGKFNTCFQDLLFSITIGEKLPYPSTELIATNEDNLSVITISNGNNLVTN